MFRFRKFVAVIGLLVLGACTVPADVDEPPADLGNFKLGFNIVVSEDAEMGPFSRRASDEEWVEALKAGIERRFRGYDGDKLYHIGIKVDGYALAVPGVPLVFNPKSVLVITVNIWDDSTGETVNPEAKALTIFEGVSDKTLISSGLTQSKQQQMRVLSDNAAKAIQDWILENPEWVGLPPLPESGEPAAN